MVDQILKRYTLFHLHALAAIQFERDIFGSTEKMYSNIVSVRWPTSVRVIR